VYFSGNFALSTGILNSFTTKEVLLYVLKYAGTGLMLGIPYFIINEGITTVFKHKNIENYFLSYSLSAVIVMPAFASSQRVLRKLSWSESSYLAYRYVGTLCCCSLVAELLISIYRQSKLNNLTLEKFKKIASIKLNP
jgi:hypothetical protein